MPPWGVVPHPALLIAHRLFAVARPAYRLRFLPGARRVASRLGGPCPQRGRRGPRWQLAPTLGRDEELPLWATQTMPLERMHCACQPQKAPLGIPIRPHRLFGHAHPSGGWPSSHGAPATNPHPSWRAGALRRFSLILAQKTRPAYGVVVGIAAYDSGRGSPREANDGGGAGSGKQMDRAST